MASPSTFRDDRLEYGLNYVARDFFSVRSADPVPEGRHKLRFEFEPTGAPDFAVGKGAPGRLQLYVDGELVAQAEAPHTTPAMFELEGLSCGYDSGAPVLPDVYQAPYQFSGVIHEVVVDVAGELIEDDEATMRRLMAQQ